MHCNVLGFSSSNEHKVCSSRWSKANTYIVQETSCQEVSFTRWLWVQLFGKTFSLRFFEEKGMNGWKRILIWYQITKLLFLFLMKSGSILLPERKKEKILKGWDKTEAPKYQKPRIRSRRHPVKVMFLGVATCPQPEYNFDGQVF